MKGERHVPVRMCLGCRTRKPKRELVRYVVEEGTAVPDPGQTKGGRGVYLCNDPACVQKAAKRGAFPRAFRRAGVKIDGLLAPSGKAPGSGPGPRVSG